MIEYELPVSVEVDGKAFPIMNRADFRTILDVISASEDQELSENERAIVALNIFYEKDIPDDLQEATRAMGEFIAGGSEQMRQNNNNDNSPVLMDWEHDFHLIAAAMQKANGIDPRGTTYMHWWSFLAAYMEIPEESTFSFIIGIRKKLSKGKKLDENEKEFFNKNRKAVILTDASDDEWLAEDF